MSQFDEITRDLESMKRKLDRMPTKRECFAFVLGFGMATAAVVVVAVFGTLTVTP